MLAGAGASVIVFTSTWAGIEQLLRRNVKRFRGGLVFKAHRLLYHSTLGLRVIKKKKKKYFPATPECHPWGHRVVPTEMLLVTGASVLVFTTTWAGIVPQRQK